MGHWRQQLKALDDSARAIGVKNFPSASIDQRQQLVRTALAGEKLTAFPAPQHASHVAVGLMAWYFDSPDATDLCYRARIGKNSCRPLALNPNEPVSLQRSAAPRGLLLEADA